MTPVSRHMAGLVFLALVQVGVGQGCIRTEAQKHWDLRLWETFICDGEGTSKPLFETRDYFTLLADLLVDPSVDLRCAVALHLHTSTSIPGRVYMSVLDAYVDGRRADELRQHLRDAWQRSERNTWERFSIAEALVELRLREYLWAHPEEAAQWRPSEARGLRICHRPYPLSRISPRLRGWSSFDEDDHEFFARPVIAAGDTEFQEVWDDCQEHLRSLRADRLRDMSPGREDKRYKRYRAALGRVGPEGVPRLIRQLTEARGEARYRAAWGLGQMGPQAVGAVPALIGAMRDDDRQMRAHAAEALGKIGLGGAAAIPAVGRALKDDDSWVREEAAWALGRLGPESVSYVVRALKDKRTQVRWYATISLQVLGPRAEPAVSALVEALKDPDSRVRANAAEALGRIGPGAQEAVGALTHAASDKHVDVRRAAAEALKKIQQEQPTRPSTRPAKGS